MIKNKQINNTKEVKIIMIFFLNEGLEKRKTKTEGLYKYKCISRVIRHKYRIVA